MIQEEIYNKEVLGIGSDVQKKKAAARGGKKTRAHLRKNEGGGRT
jgi:hypothetical protein